MVGGLGLVWGLRWVGGWLGVAGWWGVALGWGLVGGWVGLGWVGGWVGLGWVGLGWMPDLFSTHRTHVFDVTSVSPDAAVLDFSLHNGQRLPIALRTPEDLRSGTRVKRKMDRNV